ncbi:MAG: LacI family DNA-binding transcriptional regulator, partial [Clostridia bacterium]|nr:LacI family DNA-binding transcriptional regulator [Clostridia bacterium]
MKITREMVAARAGVCKQTVSCYFSGKRKVSPAAAERIERAIKELNYVPNMLARSLVMKETRTLAVICNDIANPNYSEIIGGIERAAQREGYTVAVYNAKNFSQLIVTDIISRRMDGVIVLTFKKTIGEENFRYLAENGVRLVITHSAGEHAERYMQLEPDFSTGIDCAVRRLAELGHQKVAMLSCFQPGITIDERNKFFLESCARHFGGRAELLTGETPME